MKDLSEDSAEHSHKDKPRFYFVVLDEDKDRGLEGLYLRAES